MSDAVHHMRDLAKVIREPMPITLAPRNMRIAIFAPKISKRWLSGELVEMKGRSGFRWRIYDYPGIGNIAYPHRHFSPESWLPIEQSKETK